MSTLDFLELAASLSLQAALVVAVTHWAARHLHARTQCRLWTGCYVVLLGLVMLAVVLPHPRLLRPWTGASESRLAEAASLQSNVGRVVLVVWTIGMLVSLTLLVYRMVRVSRFLKKCVPLNPSSLPQDTRSDFIDAPWNGAVGSSSSSESRFGKERSQSIHLFCSAGLSSPFCWQFHKPCIVLPDVLLALDDDELRFIIRHEIEHLRTGHPLQQFLQRVVEVLFWFHPMVWWAAYRTEVTREFVCDDAAIQSKSEIASYLRMLLTIVEQSTAGKDALHAPLAFARGKSLMAARAGRLVARTATPSRCVMRPSGMIATFCFATVCMIAPTMWVPANALASPQTMWSPWPAWTADVLHDFDIHARDFELNSHRVELHEVGDDDSDDWDHLPVGQIQ